MTDQPSPSLLIVEDEESVLRLLASWLRDAGYDIVTCTRFEDARRYLVSWTPSALVTDVRLGAYNGLQLAMFLHDRSPEVPIVVFSAFDDPLMRREAQQLGAAFLVKPMAREDLLETLRSANRRN